MFKASLLPAACCVLLATPVGAQQHAAHVHGSAVLNVVLENERLVVQLESPAANLLGFEHAPGNEAQRKLVAETGEKLSRADQLFVISRQAGCSLATVDIESPFDGDSLDKEEGHEHEHGEQEDHEHHEEDPHSDYEATWQFECGAPGELTEVRVNLFEVFTGFEEIDVNLVTSKRQTSVEIEAANPVIAF